MSFTIYYTSTRSVTREEAEAIRLGAQQGCQGRSWLSCEPISFFPDLQDGRLIGGSKPNLKPRREEKRAVEDPGLPDGRPRDLLEILARLSREHSVDWELMHEYGRIGRIQGGAVDPKALDEIEALGDIGGLF
jgi:hypothetical protein